MIEARKIEKLRTLFGAAPEPVLRQLHGALTFGAGMDPDGLPYDHLLELIGDIAAARGLSLADDESVTEDATVSEEVAVTAVPEEAAVSEEAVAPEDPADDDEPLLLNESVETIADELAADEPAASPVYQPPRNAMHAFFGPFEPLIIDPPKFQPRLDGYICSTSLPAIWRLLNEEASGVAIRDAWIQAEVLSEPAAPSFYHQLTEEMHLAAREVLDDLASRSREDPAVRRALISRLGSNAALGDLFEFQTLLPLGGPLKEAFTRVRPSLADFSGSDAEAISKIIVDAAKESAALAGYLQLSVLSYMSDPWRALLLQQYLTEAQMPGGEDSCLIADHLIAYVTAQPEWLDRLVIQDPFRPETVEAMLAFGNMIGGLREAFTPVDEDGTLQERLATVTDKGGNVLANHFKQALAKIHLVLPLVTHENGQWEPDLGWADRGTETEALIGEALAAADFISRSEIASAALRQETAHERARRSAVREIDGYAGQLLELMRTDAGESRPLLQKMSAHVCELTGILLGREAQDKSLDAFAKAAKAA